MRISLYGLRVLVDPVAVDGLDLGACLLGWGWGCSLSFFCGVLALQGHEGIASSCRKLGMDRGNCLIYHSLCLFYTAESVDGSVA